MTKLRFRIIGQNTSSTQASISNFQPTFAAQSQHPQNQRTRVSSAKPNTSNSLLSASAQRPSSAPAKRPNSPGTTNANGTSAASQNQGNPTST
jgi:hypothetical protein